MFIRFPSPAVVSTVVAVVFAGAITGFFYAWVCSTMWGLDQADPRVAIEAMQAMNASVRNAVFFPAFFLTPVALGAAAALTAREGIRAATFALGVAAVVYLVGGLALTGLVNVPMNETLGALSVPGDRAEAQQIWSAYSARWQVFNIIRTIASLISFVLGAGALVVVGRGTRSA